MPESVPQRCKEYASYVEGSLWCIEKRCGSRNEEDIFAEVGRMFRAITTCARRGGEDDTQSEAGGVGSGARGRKRKRTWLTMDESEIQPSSEKLADSDIFEALIHLSLDKWESGERFGSAKIKTWTAHEAVNCQTMWRKLSMEIENGDIIPFYSEYMEPDKVTSPGFGMMDVCFVYEPETAGDRSSRNL